MKKFTVLWSVLFFCCLGAAELDLSSARLRNTQGTWVPPRIEAVKPGRSAELYFAFPEKKDISPYNCIVVEITPLQGKFIQRNLMTGLFAGKEFARVRPDHAQPGALLELNKKITLYYNISRPKHKQLTGLRFFFNRLEGDEKNPEVKLLFHKISFVNRFVPRDHRQFAYRVSTPTCVLLKSSDRGLTPREACYDDHGPRLKHRPTPIAKLLPPEKVAGKGSAEKESISVDILNESALARTTEVRFGVPFAQKKLFSVENIRLCDEKGRPVPAQYSVLSRYGDNSLRHLFVTASVTLAPRARKNWQLLFGNQVKAVPVRQGIRHTFFGGVFSVDTGRLKGVIRKKGFKLVENLTVDGRPAGKFLPVEIVMADGKKFTLGDPESFEIIESGPLRLTLRAAGRYTGNAGSYICRFTFLYNQAAFSLEYTHINSVLDWEFTDFKSLAIPFVPAGKIRRQERLFQETDAFYSRNGGKRIKGRLSGAFVLTDKFGVALADFYQRYPKAVTTKGNKAVIELLPRQPHKKFNMDLPLKLSYLYTDGNYRMKWGMSFSERMTFDFAGTPEEVLKAERDLPVTGVLPFAYYRKAGFAPDDDHLAPVNAKAEEAFKRYLARQESEREYGFFNYGDSFGERGHSWTNNEYDPVHGVLETYLRTGDRAMLRYAVASARHQADVDTCHAYPNAYFIGANLQHAVGHSGVGRRWSAKYNRYTAAGNGHSWVRGRLLVWLLTGDTTVMDSAYMFGDHAAFAAVPNYKTILGKAPRETGWMLRALSALWSVTGDPAYFKAAKTMADLAVRECAYEKGAWPRVVRRLNSGYGIGVMGNNNFQVAVMIKGLCDYYKIFPDLQVKRAIISSARWLAKGFNPGNGAGFNYDIDSNGRGLNWPVSQLNSLIAPALAEAAVLADDPALFAVARRAFAPVVLGIAAVDHKHFAIIWTFFADYLRAEAQWNKKHGLRSDYSRKAQQKVLYSGVYPEWRVRGSSRWEILSLADDASITLRRWIRSGTPRTPVTFTLRSADGKILTTEKAAPGILRQDFSLTLPGKKGSRFYLDISDSFNADWMMAGTPGACYGVFMKPEGLASSQNGLRRFFIRIPAGKSAEVRYSGSHLGFWGITIEDQGRVWTRQGCTEKISLDKIRADGARFTLPAAPEARIVQLDCFAATDARIAVKGVAHLTADRRFLEAQKEK